MATHPRTVAFHPVNDMALPKPLSPKATPTHQTSRACQGKWQTVLYSFIYEEFKMLHTAALFQ